MVGIGRDFGRRQSTSAHIFDIGNLRGGERREKEGLGHSHGRGSGQTSARRAPGAPAAPKVMEVARNLGKRQFSVDDPQRHSRWRHPTLSRSGRRARVPWSHRRDPRAHSGCVWAHALGVARFLPRGMVCRWLVGFGPGVFSKYLNARGYAAARGPIL
eukprot:2765914-Pyramimonas_sp.AAC.1